MELEVGGITRHRQNTHGVGVTETAFPSLKSDNGRTRLNDPHFQRASQAESNAVVNLKRDTSQSDVRGQQNAQRRLHLVATGVVECPSLLNTRTGNSRDGDASVERPARVSSLHRSSTNRFRGVGMSG